MKVSVIIPIYNTQKYLDGCFESIINQTESDLEIILVDDGSEDDGGSGICDAYAEKGINAFGFCIKKTSGMCQSARNSGIDIMSGQYCCFFIDSDDWVFENYIAVLLNNLKSYSCDISVCGLSGTNLTENNSNDVTIKSAKAADELV